MSRFVAMAMTIAAMLVALVGCGYRPPAQTDTASPTYEADLKACHQASEAGVTKQNAKRALTWFASPVSRWSQIGDATGSCMASKGYGQVRWCQPGELGTSGNIVVTAAGVQCVQRPTRKPT